MDKRFKPIGGMFQGVRGSTSTGGAQKYADKLVKLNKLGIVDDSCLSEDIRAAGSLSEDLQNEAAERRDADASLGERLGELENAHHEAVDDLEAKTSELKDGLDALDARESGDKAEIDSSVHDLSLRTSSVENEVSECKNDISDAENEITRLNSSVLDVSSRTTSLSRQVESSSGEILRLQGQLSDIATLLNTISEQMLSWASNLVTLSTDLASLKNDFENFKNTSEQKFDTVDEEISTLETKVDAIYDRIVDTDQEQ